MGMLDKVMFWKKKDDFGDLGLDKDFGGQNFSAPSGLGSDAGGFDETQFSNPGAPSFANPQFQQQQSPYPQANPYSNSIQNNVQSPSFSQPQFNQPYPQANYQQPSYQQPSYQQNQPQDFVMGKIEVLSSKIDALRASLDSINQRLANIERMAGNDPEPRRRGW